MRVTTIVLTLGLASFASQALAHITITIDPVKPIALGIDPAGAMGITTGLNQSSVAITGTMTNTGSVDATVTGGGFYYNGRGSDHDTYADVGGAPMSIDPFTLHAGETYTGIVAYAVVHAFGSSDPADLVGKYDSSTLSSFWQGGTPYSGFRYIFDNSSSDMIYFQTSVVPEPSSVAALGLGAVALLRRRKRA